MPTERSSRSASSRCSSVAVAPGAIADDTLPDERRRVRHRPHDRPAGRAASSVAIVTPGRDRQDERVARQRVERGLEGRGDVARLDRDDDDVGVGDRPRRARHDAHLRELGFEVAPAVGVDLGDREGIGLVAAVEQARR